jgi:hypothetical protein
MRNKTNHRRTARRKPPMHCSGSARPRQGARWLAGNSAAIAAYNAQEDAHGTFADTLRAF